MKIQLKKREIQMCVELNHKPHDMTYTDGSITRNQSEGWLTARRGRRTIHRDSDVHRVTTSGLTMEEKVLTHAVP